jgi:diguanylate cyclase (GGDEF)-like protein
VEHYTPEVLIRRIHNEISNIMPVLGCALITREKESEKFQVVSTINDFAIDDNHEDIFYKTVELNDIYVTEKILSFPVKIDVHKQIVFMCYKDIQSRQLREEEIRIIYSTAKQMAIFIDRFELYKQLQHLSNTDGLTGLYNHRFFHICLDKEINRCQTYHKPLSLIIMDMDNFKQVNDRFGHQEGDRILSIIAGLLKECFRNSDVLARYGGDEFVAVLPETDGATAMHIAERILEKIRVTDISVGGETIRLSISAGISCVGEEEVISSRELISKADTALYEAKKTGRGSIKFL